MSDFQAAGMVLCALGFCLGVLPFLDRSTTAGRLIPCSVCVALIVRTMWWRYTSTLPPLAFTFENVWAYVFLGAETLSAVSGCLLFIILSRTIDRRAESRKFERWYGDDCPRVDMFIATYNEEEAILNRTIIGAASQDYENVRVFVLDDGRRPWLEALCHRRNVGYLTRSDNSHAKAGNMTAGLTTLENRGDASPFVAILDADFVAQPDFVRRALALFHDPRVGCVQTPQHFFNADPLQHGFRAGHLWPDEQRFFFDVLLASKDAWGVAFSCGTSSICRRQAIHEIGGFPVESVTEDMLLSVKMRTKNWRTVYLNERLSMGLAPEGLQEYITQRGRWCLGFMQIFRGKWGPLTLTGLPFVDRVSLVDAFLYWAISFPFRILCMLTPAVFCFTGAVAVRATGQELLYYIGPTIVAQLGVITWVSRGRILPILADASQLLIALDAIKATSIGLLKPHGHKFKVTAKGGDRSRSVVQWAILRRLGLLLGIILGAVIFGTQFSVSPIYGSDGASIWLFWAYYNMIVLFVTMLTCIELPRHAHERFRTSETGIITAGGVEHSVKLAELSIGDAVIRGMPPAPEGTPVQLALDGVGSLGGVITKVTPGFYEIAVDREEETSDALVRKLFSGQYQTTPEATSFLHIVKAVTLRAVT